ncbi:MAG: energy transducer TonB [Verrucomicrobia bacterium]|nr:energy transducer TonB [Verrucomicrobiota bacterium]
MPPAEIPTATTPAPAAAPAPIVPATPAEPRGVAVAAPAPVAEVFVPPAFRVRQEPAYPERARRAGVAGVVGVRIALAADGSVRAVELTASSGSRLLDEAALEAARSSTFEPATRGRAPVSSEAVASYRFELR